MYYTATSHGRHIVSGKDAALVGRIAINYCEYNLTTATLWRVDEFGVQHQVMTWSY